MVLFKYYNISFIRTIKDYSTKYRTNVEEKYKVNNEIKATIVQVVDDEGIRGKLPIAEALELAAEKELDLVEVAPNQDPPVCKIMSYSKFKYEESKKTRKGRVKGKVKEEKEMRFPTTIEEGDITHKLKRINEFLEKGHKVKVTIFFKGRTTNEMADNLTKKILTELEETSTIEQSLKKEGRRWFFTVAPKKGSN
jgi:translation initiation factor IF-3